MKKAVFLVVLFLFSSNIFAEGFDKYFEDKSQLHVTMMTVGSGVGAIVAMMEAKKKFDNSDSDDIDDADKEKNKGVMYMLLGFILAKFCYDGLMAERYFYGESNKRKMSLFNFEKDRFNVKLPEIQIINRVKNRDYKVNLFNVNF